MAERVINASRFLGCGVIWLIVWTYRITLGWLLGGHCRFVPSCSQYMLDATRKYGPIRGGWMGLKRIARCHPLCKGGHDPA